MLGQEILKRRLVVRLIPDQILVKHRRPSTLVCWGELGIQALLDGAYSHPSTKNSSLCLQLMSSLAAGSALPPLAFVHDPELREKIEAARTSAPDLAEFCRLRLAEFILSFDPQPVPGV